jgi:cytochrome P450
MSSATDLSLLDVLTPEGTADPYPIYERMRNEQPVFWDHRLQSWVLTRYGDVASVAKDTRLSAARAEKILDWIRSKDLDSEPVAQCVSRQFIFLDPPDHTRLRGLVLDAFSPRGIAHLEPRIQRVVDGLLDQAAERGEMDVVGDFARRLPAIVIADILGVPPEDRERFQHWCRDYAVLVGGVGIPAARATRHVMGIRAFSEYLRRLISSRQRESRDDLLQSLMEAEWAGRLTSDELFANYVLVATGGQLTTAALIASGLYTLLQHPDERASLARDPSLIRPAVEEMLRFESPIQSASRRVVEAMEIGGQRVHAGQFVRLHLGAANRDPAQFDRPQSFDIARHDNRHLSFNLGAHFCLGAALGRLEGHIALSSILERFPRMRLADETPRWRMDLISRGLKSLEVIL